MRRSPGVKSKSAARFGFSAATVCDDFTNTRLKSGVSSVSIPSLNIDPGVGGVFEPDSCAAMTVVDATHSSAMPKKRSIRSCKSILVTSFEFDQSPDVYALFAGGWPIACHYCSEIFFPEATRNRLFKCGQRGCRSLHVHLPAPAFFNGVGHIFRHQAQMKV